MQSKHFKNSLPSIQFGLFHYTRPFEYRVTLQEIEKIAEKYSFNSGDNKVAGLNYLYTNNFITLEQADFLASQLVNWRGAQQSTFFTDDHMDALIALIQDQQVRQIPVEEVVNHLQLLTEDEARRIANGLTREEAITNLPFSTGL